LLSFITYHYERREVNGIGLATGKQSERDVSHEVFIASFFDSFERQFSERGKNSIFKKFWLSKSFDKLFGRI